MQKVHAIWLPRDFDDEGTDVSFIKFHECPSGATQGRDCMRKQPYCLFCQVLINFKAWDNLKIENLFFLFRGEILMRTRTVYMQQIVLIDTQYIVVQIPLNVQE